MPTILELAGRIEQDIHQKQLQPGDAYLGAADAARMLRVSTRSANRALQLLAHRNVLARSQRKGTFISQPLREAAQLSRVHLLVHQAYFTTDGVLADGVVVGMQGELPGVEIQFNFMPHSDESEYVERLITEAMRSPTSEGFVLVRVSLATQRMVAACGLPAVCNGVLFPSIENLPWLDRDHFQVGVLLARHLLQRGHRRLAVLMHERVLPGHHYTLDGIRHTLEAAGLSAGALVQRNLPVDEQAIAHEVCRLVSESPEPLGFICRPKPIADAAAAAIRGSKLPGPQPTITVCEVYGESARDSEFAFTRQVLSSHEIGTRIGRMLAHQARGEELPSNDGWIPVTLVCPE